MVKSQSKSGLWLLAIVSGLAIVGYIVWRKTQSQPVTYQPLNFRPVARLAENPQVSAEYQAPQMPAAHTYKNTETWEIEWTPDGLPGKVTIHRDAVQT